MKQWIHPLLNLQLLGLLLALLALCASPYYWFADLFTHFALHYSVVAMITVMGFLLLRTDVWKVLLCGLCAVVFSALVASLYLPKPLARHAEYGDISVLQFNVNYSNPELKELAGWINNYSTIASEVVQLAAQTRPDIVLLQEVSPAVAEQLQPLKKAYPYQFIAPKEGAFGMAVLSRIPFSGTRSQFKGSWNEYTELRFQLPRRTALHPGIAFILTELHAVPPIGHAAWQQRNEELKQITVVVNHQPESGRILVGDMNITPYSPWFWEMERSTRLRNVMQGGGLAGTWPSFVPAVLRIPIDHMLVSDNIEVLSRTVEAPRGSDHLPVMTKLRIYASD